MIPVRFHYTDGSIGRWIWYGELAELPRLERVVGKWVADNWRQRERRAN